LEEKPLEAQTDVKTYLDQGRQALSHGEGREAAIAYAHAAQLEPENPHVHLGLAEANLALGSYGIVQIACQKAQELAPDGSIYELAQALLHLLDRRYDQALLRADSAIKDDPGNAYAHALRAYLLRVTGQDYDAGLARSRASRLSFGGTFEKCFPPVEPVYAQGYAGQPTGFTPPATPDEAVQPVQQQREQVPTWSRPSQIQRRMIRTRFWMSQNPRFVTNALIVLNVLTYIVLAFLSQNVVDISQDALITMGGQVNLLVAQGEFWRIFTAMFLHVGIAHIGLNMLSIFFIGPAVELFYGKWRYLVIYLVSGIAGGVASYLMLPQEVLLVGASGAIAGIFGALGAFFFVNRRALGAAANAMLGQWLFWLLINVAFGFSVANIGWQAHLGGLVCGLILGVLLLPPLRRIGRGV
jgi:membrane associated rhomboid family serine protease